MPVLSLDRLTVQLDEARRAYNAAVVRISQPYVRDTFRNELGRVGLESIWESDELPTEGMTRTDDHDHPMLNGMKVHRIISKRFVGDIDEMRCNHQSVFTVLDELLAEYANELVKLGAVRTELPRVHASNEAFEYTVFIYGLVCVKP